MEKIVRSKLRLFAAVFVAVFCLTLFSAAHSTCKADVAPVDRGWWAGDEWISLDLFTLIIIAVAVALIATVAAVVIAVLKNKKNKK
ncbi:MAG: hypothetical protein II583_05440 [Oscillospiraceae bacterium]|nr:hypothetical protein [Oscillospiraceae bacterium]